MKTNLIRIMLLMIVSVCCLDAANASLTGDFYVARNGSDSWSGTLANPNQEGSDGPFATLERARNAVRKLKKSKTADILVLIREGTYQLDKTVVFGLEDSGEGDSTITYAAYPGEKPAADVCSPARKKKK